jgi:hypothetical protein
MNSQLSRRTVLCSTVAATVGLAGCSSDGDSSTSGGSGETNPWEEILNTRETIQEDAYNSWSWSTEERTELRWEFTVRDGPEVELFVLEPGEFDEYEAENRFYTVESASGTSGSSTFTVESGSYRFVLDNTDSGNVQPPTNLVDDAVEVELSIEARSA